MKLRFLFPLLTLLLTVAGCKKATYLDTDTKEMTVSIDGLNDTIMLRSDVYDISLDSVPNWIKTELVDSMLMVRVGHNDSGAERTGNIVITNGDLKLTIPVVQQSKATRLELPDGNKIQIGKDGGTETLKVDCDGNVTIEGAEGFEAKYSNGTLTVTAPKNEGGKINKKIKLTADELTQEVDVSIEGNICPTCKGTGTIKCKPCMGTGYDQSYDTDCPSYCTKCGGKGFAVPVAGGFKPHGNSRKGTGKVPCPDCQGK